MSKYLNMIKEERRLPLALLLVALVTVAVYWPALHNGFIDYDDTDYVTANTMVGQGLTLEGFLWSFSAFHAANWHPLTWLSHMLDVQLFDLNPAGHHAVSVLLHGVNSLLVCLVLNRLTGRLGCSLLVALLFALHPLHVESVAWVSERKDVLSTLFWLLAMWAYTGYARHPGLKRYLAVALWLALGLMAKQMLVTLPLVFLLMDFWPLNRLNRDNWKSLVLEKIPLLLLSGAAALVTIAAQGSAGVIRQGATVSPLLNSGNALLSYLRYVRNMFWPVDLALFYPFDAAAVTLPKLLGALLILALVSALALWQRRARPYLLFGWLFYLVTLLPVIGFLRAGDQALADRYTYVPLLGLFLMLVWGGAELARRWRYGTEALAGATAVALCLLGALSVVQIGYWRSSHELFAHALAVVPNNWLAHNNMGILLARQFRPNEALVHFQESVRLNPQGALGFRNLGTAYQALGDLPRAIDAFREAVRINPGDVQAHYQLGFAYLLNGNADLAYQQYQQLSALDEAHARPLLDAIRMSTGR